MGCKTSPRWWKLEYLQEVGVHYVDRKTHAYALPFTCLFNNVMLLKLLLSELQVHILKSARS